MTAEFLVKDVFASVFTAWIISQVILKIITFSCKRKKIFWRAALIGGGMPSSHTALVSALSTAIGFNQGFNSAIFLVTLVFSLLIVYDVLHKKKVIAGFLEVFGEKHPKKHLLDELGHSVMEVLVGMLIGIAVAVAFYQN